jgi:hypothetical protein
MSDMLPILILLIIGAVLLAGLVIVGRRNEDDDNPLQRRLAGGCNLNRPIAQLITEAGFEITTLERHLLSGVPRLFSKMYCGVARLATP